MYSITGRLLRAKRIDVPMAVSTVVAPLGVICRSHTASALKPLALAVRT